MQVAGSNQQLQAARGRQQSARFPLAPMGIYVMVRMPIPPSYRDVNVDKIGQGQHDLIVSTALSRYLDARPDS